MQIVVVIAVVVLQSAMDFIRIYNVCGKQSFVRFLKHADLTLYKQYKPNRLSISHNH